MDPAQLVNLAGTIFDLPSGSTIPESYYQANFVKGKFLYNSRVALSFLPCLFVVLIFGGKITIGTILFGLLVAGILDTVGQKEATFASLWVTLVGVEIGLLLGAFGLLRHSVFNLFLLLNIAFFILLTGMWISVQFTWLHSSPSIVLIIERMLMSCLFVPTSVIITWASLTVTGIDNAPFYSLGILYMLYLLYGLPLQSSYKARVVTQHSSGQNRTNLREIELSYVCGKFENFVHTVTFLFTPALLHIMIYHRVLFTLFHMSNLLLLIFLPWLGLQFVQSKRPFWWTGMSQERAESMQKLMTLVSLLIVVGCLEYRVVFRSFGHLIALFPPWNYIFVTVTLYSLFGFVAALLMGYTLTIPKVLMWAFALTASFASSLVVGLPWFLLPVPWSGAYSSVEFYFTKKLSHYLIFAVSCTITLFWFLHKTLWFLEYEFTSLPFSLHHMVILLTDFFFISLLIPGLLHVNTWPFSNGIVMGTQAAALCIIEQTLYQEDEAMYPFYLIIFTSIGGAYLILKVGSENKLDQNMTWLISCLYLAKLTILFGDISMGIFSTWLLLVTISPLYYFYTSSTMTKQQGLVSALSVGIAAFVTRHGLPAKILYLITQQEPTESTMIAFFLIIWAIGCLPLSFRAFPHLNYVRNTNLLVLSIGILFIALQPEVGVIQSAAHFEDYQISPRWPQACLFACIALILATTANIVPLKSAGTQAIMSVAIGSSFALFITGTYLPMGTTWMLHSLFVVATCLAVLFIVFTQWPSASVFSYMTWVFAAFEALLPVIFMHESHVYSKWPGTKGKESLLSARIILLGTYVAINVFIALMLKFKLSIGFAPLRQPMMKRGRVISTTSEAYHYNKATVEFDWLAYAGNIASFLGFVLAVTMNMQYLDGSQTSIFFLAPILLLLNQDQYLLKGLSEKNRYFPIIAATSAFLVFVSVYNLILKSLLIQLGFKLATSSSLSLSSMSILINLALLLMTIPSHYYFNIFMWNFAKQNSMLWTIIGPLNVLPAIFSSLGSIQMLGVIGLLAGAIHYFVTSRISKSANRVL